jgi:hypothetical protein
MNRFKTFLKWAAIVAGVTIVALVIADAVFIWRTGSRLEERLDALRRAGEPLEIADLGRKPVPPERNADEFLRRADPDLAAIEKGLEAAYPRVGYPSKGTLTPAEQEKLETLFAAHPQLMTLLEQAADAPDYDPRLDTTQARGPFLSACLELAARHRPLYRVLRARSALLLSRGHPDDAVAAQLLLLRLTRHWRGDPMLLGYLVRTVGEYLAMEAINEVLQAGPVSPATRRAIDDELARHDTRDEYSRALRTERAIALLTARQNLGGGFWPMRGFANDLMLRMLDTFDRYLADTSRPYLQVAAERRASPPDDAPLNPYRRLLTLLEPRLFAAVEAGDRVRAMARSLRVLSAIQARVPPGSGQVPSLGDLGLPAEATTDPYNGEPLRVQRVPRGWMVYSVGSNGIDDGGQLERAADIGVGPPGPVEAAKTP